MTCPVLACKIQPAALFLCTANTVPSAAVAGSVTVVCPAFEMIYPLFTAAACEVPEPSFQVTKFNCDVVANVPDVGKVTLVVFVIVKVEANAPDVVKLPPNVI